MTMETFLETCVDDYEALIDSSFYSAKSSSELDDAHQEYRSQLLGEVTSRWRKSFGSKVMPSDLEKNLKQSIDISFKQLKKHFEKAKKRDQNQLSTLSAQQDALQYYNEEMEKYFRNFPSASTKEIQMKHGQFLPKVLAKATEKAGAALTSQQMISLKSEIEKRFRLYKDKALMSSRTTRDPAIGIDLGTTMCCVMVFHRGKIELVPNRAQGNRSTTPSYVCYRKDNTSTFGWVAKDEAYKYPEMTVYDAKRMIGRQWKDEKLQADRKRWPFEIVDDEENPKIKISDRLRYPHEVSARLLAYFRVMAEQYLGLSKGSVKKAVITVPAYFTEPQRRATNEAAMCAGLEVLNILSEPTAAAIAYSWERTQSGTRKALIYDLGGGTFDVAIAEVKENGVEILGVDGDTHLGGQDFDQLLMDYCLDEFKKNQGVDLLAGKNSINKVVRDDARSVMTRVKLQCEKVKESLSTAESATVDVMGVQGQTSLTVKITKDILNEVVRPLIQQTIDIVARAVENAKSKGVGGKSDIDDVILVGGSTRMPLVVRMLTDFFDGKELCQNINPDEAVAYGAAVQAALINKDPNVKKIVVQDVTPMTLGTKCIQGEDENYFSRCIPKNSRIPCEFSTTTSTRIDNQTNMHFEIYQGENDQATLNKWLGKFTLYGIPPRPKNEEEAEVIMRMNSMGILQVEAVSKTTGSSNAITITSEKLGMTSLKIQQLTNELRFLQD